MNSKKSILIYCHWLESNGGERALVNLIKEIPNEQYDITLMLFSKNFAFLQYIPNYINIITPPFKKGMDASFGIKKLLKQKFKQRNYFIAVCLLFGRVINKLFNCNYLIKTLLFEKQNIKYDYIFNWSGINTINDIVCCSLYKCNKKYVWIHFLNFYNNKYKTFKKNLRRYDIIFCVSNEFKNEVKKIYKKISYKVELLYNIIDTEKILQLQNNDGFRDNYNGFRILSVGRLNYLKGYDIAIKTCKILIDKGYDFKWYIVGEGEERQNLTNLIKENNLGNNFILLGAKDNPYPYFKECDIYVQCSRAETFCMALAEAKIFNKPIVTTIFPGTYEQIKNNETGIIVETNPEAIADGIKRILDNKELKGKLIDNLRQEKQKPKPDYFSELKKYL